MARYGCTTMGTYARMLMEDALHAIDGEMRVEGDGGDAWVKDDGVDAKRVVSDAFKEIAHHLDSALASACAFNVLMYEKAIEFSAMDYLAAKSEELKRFEDDWAWVYEDDEDGQPE